MVRLVPWRFWNLASSYDFLRLGGKLMSLMMNLCELERVSSVRCMARKKEQPWTRPDIKSTHVSQGSSWSSWPYHQQRRIFVHKLAVAIEVKYLARYIAVAFVGMSASIRTNLEWNKILTMNNQNLIQRRFKEFGHHTLIVCLITVFVIQVYMYADLILYE